MKRKLLLVLSVFLATLYSFSQVNKSISVWDPFDYSIYKTGLQYIDDYPAQEDTTIYPKFSWNKVPRWLAIRSGDVFSDADINTIANNHEMVMLEKYNNQGTASTEQGTLAAAARLKAVNPDLKILFYWNSWINYYGYDANTEYEDNKWEWSDLTVGADGQDTLDMFKDLYYTYNYDSPGCRAWWVKTALNMVQDDLIDGVFVDKVHSYEGLYFNQGEPANNYIRMLDSLSQLLPDGKIFFGNILRNERWGGSRGHMNYADGSYWERWEYIYRTTDPVQTEADARCVNMQLAREAILKGKIVNFMCGGTTTAIAPTEAEENEANMHGFLREDVQFPLGVYLIIADTNAYFNFKESVDTGDEDWMWDASFLEELNRPLGKPLNDPVKNGYIYTRSYEKVDVWVNVETTEAKLTWKDYPDFLKLTIVVRDAVSNDVITDARVAVEDLNRLTNDEGLLPFGLDSGRYDMTISKGGYVEQSVSYELSSNSILIIYLEPKAEDGSDEITGYFQITKRNTPDFCLYGGDVNIAQVGDQLTLADYVENDPSTVWVEYDRGDGYYAYKMFNTDYWIDGGDGGSNDQPVSLSEWDAADNDLYWIKEEIEGGYIRLLKIDDAFVIHASSSDVAGQAVSLWASRSVSQSLQWVFHPVFEDSVSLTVTIVDSLSNEVLSGVDITFNDEAKQTGADGNVQFVDLDVPNTLAYTLSKDGYVTKEGSIDVTKNDSISLSMVKVSELSATKEGVALGVNIYPNPANDFIAIEAGSEITNVNVFSIDGRLLLTQTPFVSSFSLTLPELGQSILFVSVSLNDGVTITQKIIVN